MASILIVEDEGIVALNYASILEDAGYSGPVGTIRKGIEAIENARIDGAILHIDIGGVPVDPIIMAFSKSVCLSANPDQVGPYGDAVFLDKPCTAVALITAIRQLLRSTSARSVLEIAKRRPL
jgi:hypothetical protein